MIEGIDLYPLKHIEVLNGDIYHALKSTDIGYVGFGEAYFSQIESGKIKGWKRHNKLVLNIVVIVGSIKFVFYDDRSGSLSKGKYQEIILSPSTNYQRLVVAPGLWMAFGGMGNTTSMLMDIIPEPHDIHEADRLDLSFFPYNFDI